MRHVLGLQIRTAAVRPGAMQCAARGSACRVPDGYALCMSLQWQEPKECKVSCSSPLTGGSRFGGYKAFT